MNTIINLGNYAEERIRLAAERNHTTMSDWIVDFFATRCNAPDFSRHVPGKKFSELVHCTGGAAPQPRPSHAN